MGQDTLKLTRKIQLLVDLPNKEERKEALDKLYQWQNRCFKAANLIVSHLYVQGNDPGVLLSIGRDKIQTG